MGGRYLALLRGINVGGSNVIPMAELRDCFAELGAKDVATYIQSGNVLFDGGRRSATAWERRLEAGLSARFGYAATVVLRSHAELSRVVSGAPRGFGKQPDRFRYDVLFLKEPPSAADALLQVKAKPGVDVAIAGDGVLYFSRLIAKATQSQLSKLVGSPIYQRMTIRNFRTTTALMAMLDERAGAGS